MPTRNDHPVRHAPHEAMAVVSRGNFPVRPAHPVRTKNDGVRQVSWLAGRCRSGRLLGAVKPQWHDGRWLSAHSCRGSRGLEPRSLSIPLRGTCRLGRRIIAWRVAGKRVVQMRTLACRFNRPYCRRRNGCPQGLNREVRHDGPPSRSGTAPATVAGERLATMPLEGSVSFREGGKFRVEPASQETGPLPSFFARAGCTGRTRGLVP